MIFYNVLFYSVILVLVVFYYWSLCVFYCFISVSAVVRFKHTENGLNSNKTELLNWIGIIIFMIQIPCPPPKLQIPKRVSVIFLPQTQEDKGFEGDREENSPADCF